MKPTGEHRLLVWLKSAFRPNCARCRILRLGLACALVATVYFVFAPAQQPDDVLPLDPDETDAGTVHTSPGD